MRDIYRKVHINYGTIVCQFLFAIGITLFIIDYRNDKGMLGVIGILFIVGFYKSPINVIKAVIQKDKIVFQHLIFRRTFHTDKIKCIYMKKVEKWGLFRKGHHGYVDQHIEIRLKNDIICEVNIDSFEDLFLEDLKYVCRIKKIPIRPKGKRRRLELL